MRFRTWLVLAFLFLANSAWAVVTSEVNRTDYVGNGSVATYATTFVVKATSEVRVFVENAGQDDELTLGADYSATLTSAGLCSITLTAGNLANGTKLSIQRGIPYTQTVNPNASGVYNPTTIGSAIDRLAMQLQRLKGDVDRSIKIPYLETGGDSVTKILGNASARANKYLGFNADGEVQLSAGSGGGGGSGFAYNVLDYGAAGNGTDDDTAAIAAAQAAASDGVVYLPAGTYLISSALVLTSSLVGDGIDTTIIKADAGFSGDRMINLTGGRESLFIEKMTLDANDLAGVSHLKHVSTVGAKANRLHATEVWFYNSHKNAYAIYSEEANADAGGLTGSLFERCIVEATGKNIYLGNNEDDITFLSCRLHGNKTPDDGFSFYIFGSNTRFQGCYLYCGNNTYSYGGASFLWAIGSYGVSWHNCFFEYGGAFPSGPSSLTAIVLAANPAATASFSDCHVNLSLVDAPTTFKSFFRGNLAAATDNVRNEVSFSNMVKYDAEDYPLADFYVNGDASDYASVYNLHVEHCYGWGTDDLYTRSGKVGADEIYIRLSGHNAGSTLGSFARTDGIQWIIGEAPGVWMVDEDGTSDGAYLAMTGGHLYLQRRAAGVNGAVEATPLDIDIQAPNDSLVIDSNGGVSFQAWEVDAPIGVRTNVVYFEDAAALLHFDDNGGVNDGMAMAFDTATSSFFIQRRAPTFGANEATVVTIDMQAPANSLVVDDTGQLTAPILKTSGAGNGVWFSAGSGDQIYEAIASDLLSWNRASSAGAYETTLMGLDVQTGNLSLYAGDLTIDTAGKGIVIKEGTNAKMGTAVLVGGTVTVNTTAVTASSRIYLTSQVDGGTPGYLRVSGRVAATSFTITSGSGTDTSTVAWMIVEPAP